MLKQDLLWMDVFGSLGSFMIYCLCNRPSLEASSNPAPLHSFPSDANHRRSFYICGGKSRPITDVVCTVQLRYGVCHSTPHLCNNTMHFAKCWPSAHFPRVCFCSDQFINLSIALFSVVCSFCLRM